MAAVTGLNPDQRALFGIPAAGQVLAPIQSTRTSEASNAVGAKRKKRGGRRPKPQNLPVRREVIDLQEQKAGLVKIRYPSATFR